MLPRPFPLIAFLCSLFLLALPCIAHADTDANGDDLPPPRLPHAFDEGRLLATGGVTNVDGVGGGGLVPWATITGYGSSDSFGANAHETTVGLRNYTLYSAGAAFGFHDRLEISFAHQWFDTRGTGAKLGLGKDYTFEQESFGAKLRLFGKLVYDQDSWVPETSAGVIYKATDSGNILKAVGAKDDKGADFYIAATKLLLNYSVLADVTLRFTKSNQFGILGYGGDRNNDYQPELEASLAYLVSKRLALGGEYRSKPKNLGFDHEEGAYDLFAAYFLDKHASLTLAYVDLGSIATRNNQDGLYASLQLGF